MRHPTIAYTHKNLPVQCLSERDFLFPDADEKYVPEVLAYTCNRCNATMPLKFSSEAENSKHENYQV